MSFKSRLALLIIVCGKITSSFGAGSVDTLQPLDSLAHHIPYRISTVNLPIISLNPSKDTNDIQEFLDIQQALLNPCATKKAENLSFSPPPIPQETLKKIRKVKTRDWGPHYQAVANVYHQASTDRQKLKELRERNIQRYNEIRDTENPDFAGLMKIITQENKAYTNQIIAEEVAKMGPAPIQFAIFSMGSIARDESGIFTDLEIGFLLEKNTPEAQKYLTKLSQRLADRFFLLGEHPDVGGKGLRIDEADNAPIHFKFFDRYSDPKIAQKKLILAIQKREFDKIPYEGSRILMTTPEELANYHDNHYLDNLENVDQKSKAQKRKQLLKETFIQERIKQENQSKSDHELYQEISRWVDHIMRNLSAKEKAHVENLVTLTRNTTLLFGQASLYETFLSSRGDILDGKVEKNNAMVNNRRHEIAHDQMIEQLNKYVGDPKNFIHSGVLGEKIDLKRQFYRLPEQILTNLGFYYKAPSQSTVKIVDFLLTQGLINKEFAHEIKDLMNFAMGIRLKKQVALGKQSYAIYLDQKEFDKDLEKMQTEKQGLEDTLAFLHSTKANQNTIEKVEKKLSEIQHKIDEHLHAAPGAVIDDLDIQLLEEKYIPILQKLFHATMDWCKGNKEAYFR